MKIAVIGGGAAGMVTAYYLDGQFDVTVFEKQPILGGNIRTLNKNVKTDDKRIPSDLCIDNGVIEFEEKNFHTFHALMQELNVPMERVPLTTGFFFADGRHIFSVYRILSTQSTLRGRLRELRKLIFCIIDLRLFMARTANRGEEYFHGKPVSAFFRDHVYYRWLKMLLMYAYSIPYDKIDQIPAALGIPMLRGYRLFTRWTRINGGVYTYIEKILEGFSGTLRLGVEIAGIKRSDDGVTITLENGASENFDKVVFATPPDQVLKLLSDPTDQETQRFSKWQPNIAHTVIHTDTSIYDKYDISHYSAFDLFQKENGDAGYNAFLNRLLGLSESEPTKYNLAYNLDEKIDPEKILHVQEHHTPLYTVDALESRDEIIETNGANNTYHAGAYLYDGLHEGAVRSALTVAQLIEKYKSES
ncbi:MAG TPA: FAD-dependent oxidoreductase [Candidatus Hydrogenedentes bacterium]|nr:FAD-dependent oxidoreductase [Candidatus Hydrogenedentota bacterium]HIB54187.1 FAD-dependent oxidoreductase [Nitrospirales bacterium]